jgi:hypothetical protein
MIHNYTLDDFYAYLCHYDHRSPWYTEKMAANPKEYPARETWCQCRACETGTDDLAMLILELLNEQ